MATDKRPPPSRRTGGRVTPKGGPSPKKGGPTGPEASTRYTPPVPKASMISPPWVPWLMAVLFVLGVAVIFLHYTETLLPGAASAWWILVGLGLILGGIITATQLR
jgi:hypothetical protein